MPSRRTLALVPLLFLGAVVLRLPAGWVTPLLPDSVACEAPGGTAWRGTCARMKAGGLTVTNVAWQLLPGELLHGKLGLSVQVADPAAQGSAKLLLGSGGRMQVYDLLARLPVPSALAAGIPPGWTGLLDAEVPQFELQGTTLRAVRGALRLRDLQQSQPHIDYGSFEWQFGPAAPSDGRLQGPLRDLGGTTRLQGTLALALNGGYDLNAKVAAAAGAGEALQQALQQLGPADAEGFHPLLAAGTL